MKWLCFSVKKEGGMMASLFQDRVIAMRGTRNAPLVGTLRRDVPGGKAAGKLRPLGARTAQRAVPI